LAVNLQTLSRCKADLGGGGSSPVVEGACIVLFSHCNFSAKEGVASVREIPDLTRPLDPTCDARQCPQLRSAFESPGVVYSGPAYKEDGTNDALPSANHVVCSAQPRSQTLLLLRHLVVAMAVISLA
jgi:hypothetical protein